MVYSINGEIIVVHWIASEIYNTEEHGKFVVVIIMVLRIKTGRVHIKR